MMTLKTLTCIFLGSIICGVITGISSFLINMNIIRAYNLPHELGVLFEAVCLFIFGLVVGAVIGYVQKSPSKILLIVGSISLALSLALFIVTFSLSKFSTIYQDRHDLFSCLGMSASLTLGAWLAAMFVWLIELLDRRRLPPASQAD